MARKEIHVSSSSLYGFKTFVEKAGGDPFSLVKEADIPANVLDSNNKLIAFAKFSQLLEHASQKLKNPHFGLDFAFNAPPSIPGHTPIIFLAYLSKNLVDWANFSEQYQNAHNYPNMIQHRVNRASGTVSFEVRRFTPDNDNRALHDYGMAITYRLINEHVDSPYATPLKIRFPYDEPINKAVYEQMFNCPVEFNAERYEIIYSSNILNVKLEKQPAFQANAIANYIDLCSKSRRSQTSVAEKVKLIIPIMLGTGRCNLYSIAKLLGLGTKTLQRHLVYENTSFSEIMDMQRAHLAKKLLATTSKSSTAIAILLDYSSLKAFSFAFKRWTGTTPSKYR